jgi:ribose/xylose/arabinose/galactoside ABC-type transport system permease subunit
LLIVVFLLGLLLTLASDPVTIRGETVNNFFRIDNLLPNVATPMSWMAIMAVGATLVVISGGIDISVGSVFGCAALGTVAVLQNFPHDASPWIVIPVAVVVPLAIGAAAGTLNGVLVVGLRMHPFIVTLGTLSVLRGIALISVESKSIPSYGKFIPAVFTEQFVGYEIQYEPLRWAHLQPVPMLIMLLVVGFIWIYLRATPGGREVYAVGGNEEAARFSGLPVGRIKIRVYALAGLLAGVAGMVSAGYYGSANTATGEGYELTVIAAAVVGGASLSGGRGSALGALLGALIIKLIENGIDILKQINLGIVSIHISKEYSKIIVGTAIIVAVAVDRLSEHLKSRKLTGR